MSLDVAARVRLGGFDLDVSFTARAGEVVAVLGPNGAGKSTVLRAVAGLLPLDGGRISLDGDVFDDPAAGVFLDPQARRLGVVFQDHRLFPHLRVRDNVAFGPRSRGVSRGDALRDAEAWLRRFGLADLGRRFPRQLSGGQAQRVALARALATGPRALLLDEPLAALDVQTRAEVQGELRERLAEVAGPTLLVTHDPIEALLLANRIVVLENGRVAQSGSPTEITSRPLTPYVAALVGMNLYSGVSDGYGIRTVGGGTMIRADDAPTGEVLVAIRPSTVRLATTSATVADGANQWPARVTALGPLGDRIRVGTGSRVSGEPGIGATTVDVSPVEMAQLGLTVGSTVWLSVDLTDVHVYRGTDALPGA